MVRYRYSSSTVGARPVDRQSAQHETNLPYAAWRDLLGQVVPPSKRRLGENLLLVMLTGFLERLLFWTTVLAILAWFGTNAIMALLIWGFYDWFNAYAPTWERTFSHACACLLIAVNGSRVFLGPLTLVAARNARKIPDFLEPFWVRGWWQSILVVSLLLTLSAMLWAAWDPAVLDLLDG